MIISCDAQFFENESWDGTVEKNVKIGSNSNHDDMVEEMSQTPHVNQNVAEPSNPMTL